MHQRTIGLGPVRQLYKFVEVKVVRRRSLISVDLPDFPGEPWDDGGITSPLRDMFDPRAQRQDFMPDRRDSNHVRSHDCFSQPERCVVIEHIDSEKQKADILTKALQRHAFEACLKMIGIC